VKKSEAKKKKKRLMLIATLGTAAIIIGGLTFAWYTSKDSVTNTFKATGNLKTVVVENFTPPTNWQPGVTTDKVVQVTNTGTVDAYTRVQLVHNLSYSAKVKASDDATNVINGYSVIPLTGYSYETGTKTITGAQKLETEVKLAKTTTEGAQTAFVVNSTAIEETVKNYNNATENADRPYYAISTDTSGNLVVNKIVYTDGVKSLATIDKEPEWLAPLTGKLVVPSNVTLYVRPASGTSTLVDDENGDATDQIVESGWNYEFLGYATNGTDAFEITVTPAKDTTSQVTYSTDPSTATGSPITSTLNDVLTIYAYEAEYKNYENVVDPDYYTYYATTTDAEEKAQLATQAERDEAWKALNALVQLNYYDSTNFNTDGVTSPDTTTKGTDWTYRNGFFYYNGILESGATTKPLLESVTFKDTFTGDLGDSEISDVVYQLEVKNWSTQTTIEAALATFNTDTADKDNGVVNGDDNTLDSTIFGGIVGVEVKAATTTTTTEASPTTTTAVQG
jgi:alternate signal-mediated exported protein